eukprot:851641_1
MATKTRYLKEHYKDLAQIPTHTTINKIQGEKNLYFIKHEQNIYVPHVLTYYSTKHPFSEYTVASNGWKMIHIDVFIAARNQMDVANQKRISFPSTSDPMIGKPIKIRLLEKNDESIAIEDFQAFLLFDDARLTATASTTTTIEPTNAMITTTAPDTTNVMIATTATDTSNVMITTKHTSNNTHLHGFVSTDGMNSVNIDNDSDDSNIIHFASRMHLYIIYIPAAFLFVGVLCGVCVYCRKNRKQSGQKVTYTTKNEKNQKNIVTKPGLDLIRVISVSRDQSDHQTQGQSNETKPQRYVMTDTPDLNVESTPGMTTDPTVDSTVSADPTMMYEEVVVTEGELHHPNMEPDEFEVIGEDECETGATKGYTQSHKNEMEGITTETKRQSAVELQMIEANNDEVSVGFVSIKEAKSRTGAQREKLLNDDDFFTVFGMTRNAFYQMPQWKQKNAKRSNGLF